MSTGVNGPLLAIAIPTWSRATFLGLDLTYLAPEERKIRDWFIGNIGSATSIIFLASLRQLGCSHRSGGDKFCLRSVGDNMNVVAHEMQMAP